MTTNTSSSARGYGYQHQQLRTWWTPIVQAGGVLCHAKTCIMPSRTITPGELWDLGHTEDRTRWTGPEHQRCNRSDGARRKNARRLLNTRRRWSL